MESRIICVVDKFISFLFGNRNEYDPEQRIYNKLLQLEGEELDEWVNDKLKKYIVVAGYAYEFEGDEFEGIGGATIMDTWYHNEIHQGNNDIMRFSEIYGEYAIYKEELQNIKEKINTELKSIIEKLDTFHRCHPRDYVRNLNWRMDIISDYKNLYILNMSTNELKSYIIQMTEPIEIK